MTDQAVIELDKRIVDKPWGRCGIDQRFHVDAARQIGEIWFEPPADRTLDVMAKYLFTTERLSIQVHPDNPTARARGHRSGKDECWIVLDIADEGGELGIGTVRDADPAEVLDAARDGSIVDLVDWRTPRRGDFIYNPAGTIHALGPGLTVLEIQQAVDVTYRLYDYGRPRELHLDEAADVSIRVRISMPSTGGWATPASSWSMAPTSAWRGALANRRNCPMRCATCSCCRSTSRSREWRRADAAWSRSRRRDRCGRAGASSLPGRARLERSDERLGQAVIVDRLGDHLDMRGQ